MLPLEMAGRGSESPEKTNPNKLPKDPINLMRKQVSRNMDVMNQMLGALREVQKRNCKNRKKEVEETPIRKLQTVMMKMAMKR